MSRNKQMISREIDTVMNALVDETEAFKPEQIAKALLNQCPGVIREYLDLHDLKIITNIVKEYLKRASGSDYRDDSEIQHQQVFDFAIPVYISFRNDGGQCRYIKSDSARYGHFVMAAQERFNQSAYDAEQGKRFQRIADFLKQTPEISLAEALSQLKAA